MNAVDTNILVRYLVEDDRAQSARARRIIEDAPFFVVTTVLLETEWVLRNVYGYGAAKVCDALDAFVALPTVVLEAPEVIVAALGSMRNGLDFADALHVAGAGGCETFYTFDKALIHGATTMERPAVAAP